MQVIIFFIVKSNAVNLLICHEYEKKKYIYILGWNMTFTFLCRIHPAFIIDTNLYMKRSLASHFVPMILKMTS